MIAIEHPFKNRKKIALDDEERDLSAKMKKAARYRQASMTDWYIKQLAEHIERKDRKAGL